MISALWLQTDAVPDRLTAIWVLTWAGGTSCQILVCAWKGIIDTVLLCACTIRPYWNYTANMPQQYSTTNLPQACIIYAKPFNLTYTLIYQITINMQFYFENSAILSENSSLDNAHMVIQFWNSPHNYLIPTSGTQGQENRSRLPNQTCFQHICTSHGSLTRPPLKHETSMFEISITLTSFTIQNESLDGNKDVEDGNRSHDSPATKCSQHIYNSHAKPHKLTWHPSNLQIVQFKVLYHHVNLFITTEGMCFFQKHAHRSTTAGSLCLGSFEQRLPVTHLNAADYRRWLCFESSNASSCLMLAGAEASNVGRDQNCILSASRV